MTVEYEREPLTAPKLKHVKTGYNVINMLVIELVPRNLPSDRNHHGYLRMLELIRCFREFLVNCTHVKNENELKC